MIDDLANYDWANYDLATAGLATAGLTTNCLSDGGSPIAPTWMHVNSACIRNHPGRESLDESGNDEGDVEHAWHATDQDGWMT